MTLLKKNTTQMKLEATGSTTTPAEEAAANSS
jgi:hypothetical protein